MASKPAEHTTYVEKADAAWRQGMRYRALRYLEEAKLANVGDSDVYLRIAQIFYSMKRFGLSHIYISRALDFTPHSRDALNLAVSIPKIDEIAPEFAATIADRLLNEFGVRDEKTFRLAARAWAQCGDQQAAHRRYAQAYNAVATNAGLAFDAMMSCLQRNYRSQDELEACRERFQEWLHELQDMISKDQSLRHAHAIVNSAAYSIPFLLPYQAKPNREILGQYGNMLSDIVMRAFPRLANGPTRIPSEAGKARRVRVGVVSAQVHRHAGWRNRRGWFYALDEQEFELFLYALPGTFDDVSAFSYGAFEHIRDGVHSLASWMQQIRRDNLDILVYPEIGMSPLSHLLAAARLAPVQCMSFGHPETSGLPTMDYMLTSDLMEPANAQQYYREQIVRLPGTGFHRYPLDYVVEDQGRADFGLRETDTLFFYGHNIRKMMPEDDDYLAHIAALDATVRIVMVCDDPVDSAMIRERLAPAFRGCGVDVDDKLHIFGHLPTPSFVALIRSCDVYLDCPAWNGNNVAVDAFGQGLPPVAVEGAMMRQRHVYGLLARMGLRDLVAASKAEALTMGERLVRDPGYRRACADRVRAGYPNIFRETDCASAVAEFFRSLTPT